MNNKNIVKTTYTNQISKYSSDLIIRGLSLANIIKNNNHSSIQPKTPDDWRLQGNQFWNLEQYEESLKCYDEAIKLDSTYQKAWNNRGCALRKLGNYEEALFSLNRAVDLEPHDRIAWKNRAKLLD